jgi:hypothetical protein
MGGLLIARRLAGALNESGRRWATPLLRLLPMTDLNPVETVTPALAAPIQGRLTAAPYSFQFTGEDRLRLTVFNSLAGVRVAVHYRVDRPGASTHASRFELVPTSDRLATAAEFPVGEGSLLNVVCFASAGTPVIGQTFVKVEVIRGAGASATVLGAILQDYVTAVQVVAWPGSPLRSSLDTPGAIRTFAGSQPAAGAEIGQFVPAGARWELLAFFAFFTANATVANRYIQLDVLAGSNAKVLAPASDYHLAGESRTYLWARDQLHQRRPDGLAQTVPFPSTAQLLAGELVVTETGNIKPTDQWLAPVLTVREWLEAQ